MYKRQWDNPSIDDRLLRFESEADRDYWLEKFNDRDGLVHAYKIDSVDSTFESKYDLDDFYSDRFEEGDRCPSGHFYYEIPPRDGYFYNR